MHGRKKKSDKPVDDREEAEDAVKLLHALLQMKRDGVRGSEALTLTTRVLKINPEIATVWNYRREMIIDAPALIGELKLLEMVLSKTLKSYCVWFHRRWCFNKLIDLYDEAELSQLIYGELKLCEQLFTHDARNFHCWGYRTHVCSFLSEEERQVVNLKLGTSLILSDFSNYSAWHLRTRVEIADLDGELELIRNALFTEPSDQSVWQYRNWFLSRYGLEDKQTVAELLSVEPDCKYALLAQGGNFSKLAEIDSLRRQYYLEHCQSSD